MKFLKFLACCSIIISCQQEETISTENIIGSWKLNERVLNVPSVGIIDSVLEFGGQPSLTIHANGMLVRTNLTSLIQSDTGEVYSSQDGYNVVFPNTGLNFTIGEVSSNTIIVYYSINGPLICDPAYFRETYVHIFN